MKKVLTVFLLVLMVTGAVAQSKKKKKSRQTTQQSQPTTLEPYFPKKDYSPAKKKSSGKVTHNAREEFYERMENVEKARRKAEKESMKPQYSDPMYFGHKRPPKKRPVHKMKYCKECGIRH